MKAIVMAAGLGNRLRPITTYLPKCMVRIKGVPLLGWWLQKLKNAGIEEVLINMHYLPRAVADYVNSEEWGLKVHLVYEEQLLGSLGTLSANRHFFSNESSFLVVYADNLTDISLDEFISCHNQHDLTATMGLFRSDRPKSCGIVGLGANNIVVDFEEKPAKPKGNLSNAGIYMFRDSVWEFVDSASPPRDIGYDLLPRLTGRMSGYQIPGFFMDIGTIESLKAANGRWSYDYKQNASSH
ncbi:nucleotidyltransferase family protein [Paenibacillus sp. NPDC058071]|uniref:nucleotidyltransferase family protein n=1 Tax=Paenibacillus sp. NPDC058071 TaxID=3346326 RepID=UPI0036DA1B40